LYNCTVDKKGIILSQIIVDTSAIIAVLLNEPKKQKLIKLTEGAVLISPRSLHWEIGNAFSAMLKHNRITLKQAQKAIKQYNQIPMRFVDIDLDDAIQVSNKLNIYAYDAYFIVCAKKHQFPLLSLDQGLIDAAKQNRIKTLEV
jgi:predicted nucleic acid-binding protein